jgi:hypothetical protein
VGVYLVLSKEVYHLWVYLFLYVKVYLIHRRPPEIEAVRSPADRPIDERPSLLGPGPANLREKEVPEKKSEILLSKTEPISKVFSALWKDAKWSIHHSSTTWHNPPIIFIMIINWFRNKLRYWCIFNSRFWRIFCDGHFFFLGLEIGEVIEQD